MTLLVSRSGDYGLSAIDGLRCPFELLVFEMALFGSLRLGLSDCPYIRIRGGLGEAPREQAVSSIAVGNIEHVAEPAEFVYVANQ
jgi:hypothetical protein